MIFHELGSGIPSFALNFTKPDHLIRNVSSEFTVIIFIPTICLITKNVFRTTLYFNISSLAFLNCD